MDTEVPSENDEFILNAENEILERTSTPQPPAEPVPELVIPHTDSDTSIDTLEEEYNNKDDKNKTNFNISIRLNIKTSKKDVSIVSGKPATVVSEPVIKALPGPLLTNRSVASSIRSGWNSGQVQRKYSASACARKARRVKFYRNGDRFYSGVTLPVSAERYKTFNALLEDITRLFEEQIKLPAAILTIFNMQGQRVHLMDDLEDRQNYVCGCKNEIFRKVDYVKASRWPKFFILAKASNCFLRIPQRNGCGDAGGDTIRSSAESSNDLKSVRPRLVTLIRNGIKPRKIVRLLLNKRNSATFEHVLSAITNVVTLDSGYARKIYTSTGKQVLKLADFFNEDDLFFVYGTDRVNPSTDFQLDADETKVIQNYHKPQNLTTKARNPIKFRKLKNSRRETVSDCEVDRARIPAAIHERYVVSRVIGDGHFAIVLKIKDRQNGNPYALKIVEKNKLRGKEYHIYAEVRVMKKLSHPNIVELIMDIDTRTNMYLVLEYVSGCDLFDAVHRYKHFTEPQCREIMKYLSSAMAHIHSRNIVHRDIKLENLLVTLDKDGNLIRFKLADFSLACEMNKPLTDFCGTPMYLAPEIVNEIGYGMKVDVWAAGVVLYILLCGFPPFVSNGEKHDSLYEAITTANYDFPEPEWTHVTDDAKCLIVNMMQIEPDLRLSSEDVMDHPWTLMINMNVNRFDRDLITDSDENTNRSSENFFQIKREHTISKMPLENDNEQAATVIDDENDEDDKEQVKDDDVVVDEVNFQLALEKTKTVYEKKINKKIDRKANKKKYKKNYKKRSSRKDDKRSGKKDDKKSGKRADKKEKKNKKKNDKKDDRKDDKKDDRNDDDETDDKGGNDKTEDQTDDKTDDSKNEEREDKRDNKNDDGQIDGKNNDKNEVKDNDKNDEKNDVENNVENDDENDGKNDAENDVKKDVENDDKSDGKNDDVENDVKNDVQNDDENIVKNDEQKEVKNDDKNYKNNNKNDGKNKIKPLGIYKVRYDVKKGDKDDNKRKQKNYTKNDNKNYIKVGKKAGKNNDKKTDVKADGKLDNEDTKKDEAKDEIQIDNNEKTDKTEDEKYDVKYDIPADLVEALMNIEKELLYHAMFEANAEVKDDINDKEDNVKTNAEKSDAIDDMNDDNINKNKYEEKDEEDNKEDEKNEKKQDAKDKLNQKKINYSEKEESDSELLKQFLVDEDQSEIAKRGQIIRASNFIRCRTLPAILFNEPQKINKRQRRQKEIFDFDSCFYCIHTDLHDSMKTQTPIETSRSDDINFKIEKTNLKFILKDIDFIDTDIDLKFHKELLSTSDESSASASDTEDASFKNQQLI